MRGERRLHGFIVFGEGAVDAARSEELAESMGMHDKGVFALFIGHGRPWAVGHIANPFAVFPGNQGLVRVPGLAAGIHRGAVVDNAAVDRPAPGPIGIQTDFFLHRRLFGIAALGLVAVFLGKTAGVEPVEARCAPVCGQGPEGRHELAFFVFLVSDFRVGEEKAVDPFGPFFGDVSSRPVLPGDGFG